MYKVNIKSFQFDRKIFWLYNIYGDLLSLGYLDQSLPFLFEMGFLIGNLIIFKVQLILAELRMLDFELLKIFVIIGMGLSLIFALLYHFWNLADAEE